MGRMVNEELLVHYIFEGYSMNQISNITGYSRSRIIKAANRLRDRYSVKFKEDYIILSDISEFEFQKFSIEDRRVLFIADTHIGSKNDRIDVINEAFEGAYKRGIKTVIHLGDLVDGYYKKYPEQIASLYSQDPYEQLDRFVEYYPKGEFKTLFVTGNHDRTLNTHFHVDVGQYISEKRPDCIDLGYSVASLLFGDVKMLLLHGNDDLRIFDDFKLKKVAISVEDDKYDIIARGHGHYYESYYFKDRFCLQVPCLTDSGCVFGNNEFENSKGVIYADFNNFGENSVSIETKFYRKLKK